MEIFTYQDYLNYQKFLNLHLKKQNVNHLKETIEPYLTDTEQINNSHDKVFRKILDNKTELAKFINKVLNVKITENQLEKYNRSFITEELKNREADIIYKLKRRNIFFLIEHQTKMDYTMPLRILEYECEIIRSAINKKQLGKKDYKYPLVIPIVFYSGKGKWKVTDYIQNVQEKLEGYQAVEFAKYNVVDINDYTEEELLQEESFLSKAMLIEKAKDSNNLTASLEKVIEEMNAKKDVYDEEQKDLLITIIELTLKTKLENETIEKLIKKLKGGENDMLAVLEMLEEENKRIFRNGKKEGKKEGKAEATLENARKMLEEKIPIETIMKITGLSKEKIMKK